MTRHPPPLIYAVLMTIPFLFSSSLMACISFLFFRFFFIFSPFISSSTIFFQNFDIFISGRFGVKNRLVLKVATVCIKLEGSSIFSLHLFSLKKCFILSFSTSIFNSNVSNNFAGAYSNPSFNTNNFYFETPARLNAPTSRLLFFSFFRPPLHPLFLPFLLEYCGCVVVNDIALEVGDRALSNPSISPVGDNKVCSKV